MTADDVRGKRLRKGNHAFTREGDVVTVLSARVDKCGQIHVTGKDGEYFIEPWKLERKAKR